MRKIAAGVVGILGIAIAAVLLLRSSDEEKIERMLHECGDAAEKGDAEGIIRHLDPACTMGDQDYAAFCARIRRQIGEVKGMKIELGVASQIQKEEADVTLNVRVHAAMREIGRTGYVLKIRRSAGEWRIARVEEVK